MEVDSAVSIHCISSLYNFKKYKVTQTKIPTELEQQKLSLSEKNFLPSRQIMFRQRGLQ